MSTDPTFQSASSRIKYQLIKAISANSSAAKVYGFEKLPLTQFPAVIVKTANLEGEFWTNATNMRVYSYRVTILYQVGNTPSDVTEDRMQFAEDAVSQVVDEIINVLDSDYELGQYQLVRFIEAADGVYQPYEYEGGYAMGAELTIRVHTEYTV